MKIIKQSHGILFMPDPDFTMEAIEIAGRTCYKSEEKITDESAEKFARGIIKSGHLSVAEHMNITVRFITDRAVTHQIIRHRIGAYSQESQRYCSYEKDKFNNEIICILPVDFYNNGCSVDFQDWKDACEFCEEKYLSQRKRGVKPETARRVLPNSTKTEIVVTYNLRMWRHVLNQRCSKACDIQTRALMLPLLDELNDELPIIFGDIWEKYKGDMS